MAIRLLLVDDHPVVREGLLAIFSTQPDFDIIGEAASGTEALAQVAALHPDVVLLDMEMPDFDGVEVLRRLRAQGATVPVLVFTAFDTDERIVEAVRAGAQGYLLKGAPRDELFNAIRVIYGGGSTLGSLVAMRLLRKVQAAEEVVALSERENEVLRLVARGAANKMIAQQLAISERTVKFHVSAVLRKLDAANRTEAVTRARELGMLD